MSARRGGWVFVTFLFALGTAALLAAFRLRHPSMTGSSTVLIFDVPRELEAVLRTAVTGDPAARYPNAQAFRAAVRHSRGFLRRLASFLRGD